MRARPRRTNPQSATRSSGSFSHAHRLRSSHGGVFTMPMYDERLVQPMRQELTRIGFREMRTSDEVDSTLKNAKGTTLVVVNSICGCAARNARPAVAMALGASAAKPDRLTTVFAGQDVD